MRTNYFKCHYGYWVWLFIAIFMSIGFVSAELIQKDKKPFHPNIIYLMADDLGYADLSPEFMPRSYELMKTKGTQIPFYSMQNCAPTRTAFMTGKLPAEIGITWVDIESQFNGIAASEVLLGERMQEAWYRTWVFWKWHMWLNQDQNPLNNGFDEYVWFIHGLINYYGPQKDGEPYPDGTIWHDHTGSHDFQKEGKPFYTPQYATFVYRDATRDFIKKTKDDPRPYFAYVPFNAPHTPYSAPRKYVEMYQDRFWVSDDEMWYLYEYAETVLAIPKNTTIGVEMNKKLSDLLYYASVRAMDDAIADIYEAVEENGDAHKTFFMFASDNGAGATWKLSWSNGDLRGWKGMPYEWWHKVANFLIYPPSIDPWHKVSINVWVWDLYETFLTLAKAKLNDPDIQSTNILAPMVNSADNFRRKHGQTHLITHVSKAKKNGFVLATWSINYGHFKYILKFKMSETGRAIHSYTQELYDLSVDPSETTNVRNKIEYKEVLQRMRRKFAKFWGTKKIIQYHTTENQKNLDFVVPEEWGFPWETFEDDEIIFSDRY